jgi:hypothetical protein
MFEELGDAIDGLDIPVDSDALVAVLALRDRLDARISDAVAATTVPDCGSSTAPPR